MTPSGSIDLTLTEAADALGVHYMTAYRYVRTGILEAHRESGRWVVPRTEIERVRSVAAPADAPAPPRRRRQVDRAPRLADRLVAGDEAGCWRLVEDARAGGSDLDDLLLTVVCPALRLVGDRWETGEVSIGEEHRATVVAMRLVGRIGAATGRPGRRRGTVVLCAAPGDRHGLPTAVVADLLRARPFVVADLGADTPAEEVAAAAASADRLIAVGLCATTSLDRVRTQALRRAIALVREVTGAPVLLGGAAIGGADVAERLGADRWTATALDVVASVDEAAPRARASLRVAR